MYKSFKTLSITIFLILLIGSNAFAFHKNGPSLKSIDKNEGDKKKIYQIKFCTQDVNERKILNEKNSEKEDEDNTNKVEKKTIFKINSYHSDKFQNVSDTLDFSILKNKIKKNRYVGKQTSIENLLSFYCVQEKPTEGKPKVFKISQNSSVAKLYDQIAVINGREDRKSEIGEDIFISGKISLAVENTNLIYSKAQFIIDEERRIEKEKKKKAEANKKAQEEKNWIAANKQPLLDEIDKKINGFDDQIAKVNNDYKQLKIDYEGFKIYFKEKTIEVEDKLEDVDRSKSELKEKAKELRSAKREFLSENILDDFKTKFNSTKRIKSKNFPNYKDLEKLRDDVAKGKKKRQFTKKNKGFFDRWEILKTSKLNIKQQDKINALSGEIKQANSNIQNNINNLILEIDSLEEEFGSQLPWNLIIIGIVVLIIIIGVGTYVYLNNRRIQKLQEEADKKVGSLKSDLEGRLKDTSEQIKSVGRAAAKTGQAGASQQDQVVEEKPLTQEEIIAAKYDELVSDYREALDDFAKVAKFKQKWNGLALSRKERQDGTKTILVSSPRAFEKADIWCVTFSDKYFAFAGSTVRSNMATYMNLDFEKASREFKGVFSISTGTNYTCEPSVLRKGGAGFVVERAGKIVFPT